MVDFTAALSKQVGTAPEPKALPQGTYLGEIEGLPKIVTKNTKEGQKGLIQFNIALQDAMEDVDAGELEEAGGLTLGDGSPKKTRVEFWLDDEGNPTYQLDQFMATFGYGVDSGKTYAEAFDEMPGRPVTVALVQATYTPKNGGKERTVNNVDRAFAAPA